MVFQDPEWLLIEEQIRGTVAAALAATGILLLEATHTTPKFYHIGNRQM
jgi:hypothetical protein